MQPAGPHEVDTAIFNEVEACHPTPVMLHSRRWQDGQTIGVAVDAAIAVLVCVTKRGDEFKSILDLCIVGIIFTNALQCLLAGKYAEPSSPKVPSEALEGPSNAADLQMKRRPMPLGVKRCSAGLREFDNKPNVVHHHGVREKTEVVFCQRETRADARCHHRALRLLGARHVRNIRQTIEREPMEALTAVNGGAVTLTGFLGFLHWRCNGVIDQRRPGGPTRSLVGEGLRERFTKKKFPSPLSWVVGPETIRPETNVPHRVQRAGLSQTLVASVQKVIFMGRLWVKLSSGPDTGGLLIPFPNSGVKAAYASTEMHYV